MIKYVVFIMAFYCLACNHKNEKSGAKDVVLENIRSEQKGLVTSDTTAQIISQLTEQEKSPPPPPPHQEKNEAPPVINWDKKIVREGTLTAGIKNFKQFSIAIAQKVKKYGGYISSEQQQQDDYKIQNTLVIRVPVDQFEVAVNDLLSNIEKVDERTINAEDVTTEYIDGRSRLAAKKEVRQRYLDLLKKARNMKEILEIQEEINSIQEDIETVNGRLNYLGHSAAMSTIHFTYYEILDANAVGREQSFITKAKTAFINGLHWTGQCLIAFVSIWPLFIVVSIVYFLFVRKRLFGAKL